MRLHHHDGGVVAQGVGVRVEECHQGVQDLMRRGVRGRRPNGVENGVDPDL